MPLLTTPDTNLYYEIFQPEFTTGPQKSYPREAVLLLHGFAGTPETDFEAQLPYLRRHYVVIAPHLRGYGRSSQRSSYTLSYYRDDVADMIALLDVLEIDRVRVLGFSDGAIVGLLLAALHPERVKMLAVLGAQPTINAQDAAGIRHWLLEEPLAEKWQTQMVELHGEPYWRSLPGMYVEVQEALVAAGGMLITDEELASIRCPALIMHGKRDRIVPVDYAHVIAEHIPGSHLLLFDAGHAAHIRCEKEYTAAIMNFFHGSGEE
ncbi:MAG TPA: alpha/beta hydrolase [Ktedonobacteraceae bacterium]